MTRILKNLGLWSAVLGLALSSAVLLPVLAVAQDQDQGDQQDDPPSRVARLGYMEGSVSFQPAGENDWVQAVPNRPMTTGDKLWADQNSRVELQLGSAVIRLNANTGFSFLNLDDNTVQIQLTSGTINVRVRRLDQNDVFEVDTPNLAFSIYQPGSYRVEASEDGTYSVVSIKEGEGEATGNGQTYTLHAGQRGTFSGTDSLNAEVTDLGRPDPFDNWAYSRDHRHDDSRSARYVSPDVVGYDDLDDYGDWRDDSSYGHVWFPNRVAVGWAPYHEGHWDWIPPWGYTWVDDSPWGYAPFHYGRWVTIGGRWGWVAGPVAVRAVYAPALVVFIGGGVGVGFGGNVGWFPLGPREVYVPSYRVSRAYVNRVNISNTTVTNTTITNVYNTTIINNRSTTITNVTYVNRNVQGAVTAVPQRAFAGAQPVGRAAVRVSARDIAAAPVSARVAVVPTRESVLGARAATANRVAAPPAAVMNRQVIAKRTPPPPPVPFAKQQQALAAHPGQPLARQDLQRLRPAAAEAPHPMVRQAPPGRPATPNVGRPGNQPGNRPGNQPGNQPNAARPGQPANPPAANQPANRPPNQPAPNERPGAANPAQPNRPPSAQPNQPAPSQPGNRPEVNQPNTRPEPNRPTPPAGRNDRPPSAQPGNRPEVNQPNTRPEPNRPAPPPGRNDRTPSAQPGNRPEPNQPNNRPEPNRPSAAPPPNRPTQPNNQPEPNRPQTTRPAEPPARSERPTAAQPNNRPENARPAPSQPEPNRNQPAPRPQTPPPNERQQQRTPPAETRPAPPPQRQQPKQEQKKREEDKKNQEKQPPGA
jgi:hypothetical protein